MYADASGDAPTQQMGVFQQPARVVCRTVDEYAEALGPHFPHETYRVDDVAGRAIGKGCRLCGFEATIAIEDFKETGDLPRFRALTKGLAPEKKK